MIFPNFVTEEHILQNRFMPGGIFTILLLLAHTGELGYNLMKGIFCVVINGRFYNRRV
jgi:hypothetical protein